LACLFSCKTSEQLYNKAKTKDIVKVAKLARIDFPCTTTKIDTVITVDTLFDFLEVDCTPVINTRVDTVTKTVTVKVPQKVVTIRTIQKVEDSAKIITMQAAITDANATILAEHNRGNEYKAIAESERKSKIWWRKWAVITWGMIIVLIALRLLASKIKL
jgi:ribosomal protein L24